LRAFVAFESLRGEDAKPRLLTIVRNTSMPWLRRNRNSSATVAFEDTIESPSEPSPDPEEMLLMSCDREQVQQALERLPMEFREAVVLREMEGLSYREIATTIGIPLGTVISRLSRGRECLKRILAHEPARSSAMDGSPKKEPAYDELR